jgi:hypothetical protein
VGREGLNDERVEGTSGLLNLNGLSSSLLDPSSGLLPTLVEAEKSGLSSSLDQLIRLSDELLGEDPFGETLAGLDRRREGVGLGVPVRSDSGALGRKGITDHSTWATRTAAAEVEVTVGMGVGDRLSQYETSCLASYSRIARKRQSLPCLPSWSWIQVFQYGRPEARAQSRNFGSNGPGDDD